LRKVLLKKLFVFFNYVLETFNNSGGIFQ
jgi:hypothetical protein